MPPFALFCGLIALAGARPRGSPIRRGDRRPRHADWPRLVTLSGVHLLTPALAPALPARPSRRGCPGSCAPIWRRCTRPQADGTWRLRPSWNRSPRALNGDRRRAGGAQGRHPAGGRPVARSGAALHARPRSAGTARAALAAAAAELARGGWRPIGGPRRRRGAIMSPWSIPRRWPGSSCTRRPLPAPYGILLPATRHAGRRAAGALRRRHHRGSRSRGPARASGRPRHAAACVPRKRSLPAARSGRARAADWAGRAKPSD